MQFELNKSIDILERTPFTVASMLNGLSDEWLKNNEGSYTWSPYDILGHLIFGEKTDWVVRINIILSSSNNKLFEPFDRFAQMNENQDRSVDKMLQEFHLLRQQNLEELKSLKLKEDDFGKTGIHPEFGVVTLGQLISTWVVHDLSHIAQISRVMAKQYDKQVGPWKAYLGILNQ